MNAKSYVTCLVALIAFGQNAVADNQAASGTQQPQQPQQSAPLASAVASDIATAAADVQAVRTTIANLENQLHEISKQLHGAKREAKDQISQLKDQYSNIKSQLMQQLEGATKTLAQNELQKHHDFLRGCDSTLSAVLHLAGIKL
ncbi:keratin [Candidatus Hydrogenosomobacter endosymbioticus]|uniref:Uncharacterized protein n=1 Tax=Candidatus Hydrogenosomobacter endosymbioticus TaxID=2558174 RepID=A0ABM7V9M3_9PROT|nr:keratin [Candidatus Hydrogenosomobacter endosymbioticus]BDB96498.1 hypothetical protein HYD_6310 [Candidatus Hydrogenosomobacter endosymbioticus]